jgi:hypothetical protein
MLLGTWSVGGLKQNGPVHPMSPSPQANSVAAAAVNEAASQGSLAGPYCFTGIRSI